MGVEKELTEAPAAEPKVEAVAEEAKPLEPKASAEPAKNLQGRASIGKDGGLVEQRSVEQELVEQKPTEQEGEEIPTNEIVVDTNPDQLRLDTFRKGDQIEGDVVSKEDCIEGDIVKQEEQVNPLDAKVQGNNGNGKNEDIRIPWGIALNIVIGVVGPIGVIGSYGALVALLQLFDKEFKIPGLSNSAEKSTDEIQNHLNIGVSENRESQDKSSSIGVGVVSRDKDGIPVGAAGVISKHANAFNEDDIEAVKSAGEKLKNFIEKTDKLAAEEKREINEKLEVLKDLKDKKLIQESLKEVFEKLKEKKLIEEFKEKGGEQSIDTLQPLASARASGEHDQHAPNKVGQGTVAVNLLGC